MNGNTLSVSDVISVPSTVERATDKNGDAMGWDGYGKYLDINMGDPKIVDDMVAGGVSRSDAQKAVDFQKGIQSAYQASYDNDNSLNNVTDFGVSQNSKNATEAISDAGNMYSNVIVRNAPGDAVGPINYRQANFSLADTYADRRTSVADVGAGIADKFIPFVNPASGVVDATQASAASKGILGQEMSTADKFAVGAKTAVPFGRTISNLQGAAQYDNYGQTATAPTSTPQSSSEVREMVLKENPNATEEETQDAIEAYGFGEYASHLNKFSGGRSARPENNFTKKRTW